MLKQDTQSKIDCNWKHLYAVHQNVLEDAANLGTPKSSSRLLFIHYLMLSHRRVPVQKEEEKHLWLQNQPVEQRVLAVNAYESGEGSYERHVTSGTGAASGSRRSALLKSS